MALGGFSLPWFTRVKSPLETKETVNLCLQPGQLSHEAVSSKFETTTAEEKEFTRSTVCQARLDHAKIYNSHPKFHFSVLECAVKY